MMPSLIACLSINRDQGNVEAPCSHTTKCHGKCSGSTVFHMANNYPCVHYECA